MVPEDVCGEKARGSEPALTFEAFCAEAFLLIDLARPCICRENLDAEAESKETAAEGWFRVLL